MHLQFRHYCQRYTVTNLLIGSKTIRWCIIPVIFKTFVMISNKDPIWEDSFIVPSSPSPPPPTSLLAPPTPEAPGTAPVSAFLFRLPLTFRPRKHYWWWDYRNIFRRILLFIASILLLKTINLHTFIRSTPLCCCSSSFYLTSCHRPKPSQKLLAWGKDVSPLTA